MLSKILLNKPSMLMNMSSVGTKAPPCGPNTGSLAPGVRQRAEKK